jgi:predicted nucleic acid-binding protein
VSVLVDTPVWSLALRRKVVSAPEAEQLAKLIASGEARIIGPIRQEVLSGMPTQAHFESVRDQLRAFPDLPLRSDVFERAAEFYNRCRGRGIQGSNTDFLICAAAETQRLRIFTTDGDFHHFARHLPIELL